MEWRPWREGAQNLVLLKFKADFLLRFPDGGSKQAGILRVFLSSRKAHLPAEGVFGSDGPLCKKELGPFIAQAKDERDGGILFP